MIFFAVLLIPVFSHTGSSHENFNRIQASQIFYTPSKNYEELEEEFRKMKLQGINTVILRVFGNKGDRIHGIANPKSDSGVYYFTTHAPVIDDILGKVTQIAHSHGIKIFAWMTTRRAIYGVSDDMLDKEFSLSQGEEVSIPKLDLFNSKSVRHLENLYSDLAKYPIDGVLFQDDFIIKQMEGLGTSAKLEFLLDFKKLLDPKSMYSELTLKPDGRVERIQYTDEFWEWSKWKNEKLHEVARKLIHVLKTKNPDIKTSLNVTYEIFRKPENALAWQSHDTQLTKEFDYVAVMAYQRQMADELGIDKSEVIKLIEEVSKRSIREIGDPKKVIMKIQTLNWENREPVPKEEITDTYQAINSVSREVGIAFVPWEGEIDINLAKGEIKQ
jgi:biofilm PGA synthesis lipoprotein PgaB